MQPDCGENPCTPNTLIRTLPDGLASREADQPVFFPRTVLCRNDLWNHACRTALLHRTSKKGSVMMKLKTGFAAGVLSLAVAFTSTIPAQAVTFPRVPVPEASAVQDVQYRYERRQHRADRRQHRAERRWHGHRGYRDYRPGYRRHSDGWWYPLAAFGLGAAIGGAVTSQPRASSGSHLNWCANRYRSYRASDNTFQPYNGPRQQCVSPYS